MSNSPFFLVNCKEIDSSPDSNSASEVTGDHSIASGTKLDQHDWIGMRFSFLFGCLRVLIPNSDPS